MAGLMAQLPAWQLIDPLPILAQLQSNNEDDEEDDSLASLLEKRPDNANEQSENSTDAGAVVGEDQHPISMQQD